MTEVFQTAAPRGLTLLLEDELKKAGANYGKGPDWGVHLQTDGLLIKGQNPTSSAEAAKVLLKLLKR